MRLLAILFLIVFSYSGFSQKEKIDSLWSVYNKAIHDSSKIKNVIEIGDLYENNNPDSSLKFYSIALKLSERSNNYKFQAKALRYLGIVYNSLSDYNQAISLFNNALKINKKIDNKKGMIACYINLGNIQSTLSNYENSISFFLKALKISEEINDLTGISACYNNIGGIHTDQGNYEKALNYYFKGLKIEEKLSNKKSISNYYTNIGIVYSIQGLYDNAKNYFEKSLIILEELNDKSGIAGLINNIGIIFKNKKMYEISIDYYLKALKLFEELNNKIGIISVMDNISELNISIANSKQINDADKKNHYNEGINYALKAYNLANELKILSKINSNANHLREAYKALGNHIKALEYSEIFISSNDSLFRIDKTKVITEMETKYQSEKKQQEIEKQSLEIGKHQAEIKQQTTQKYAFIVGFLLMLLVAGFASYSFIIKRKANKLLSQKNTEIEQKNDEITAQRDEIEAQRNQVVSQKEQLQHIHTELTDSIYYAERIQRAVLPDFENLTGFQNLSGLNIETFILFKPKDIVAGDFYWATRVDKWTILCVADCTGHGVPGAFMSMLGISFLNEIVRKDEVTQANHVLNHLRKYVIQSLQQRGVSGEQKDGMDIALCVIDSENNLLQYSGANNSLYLICDNWSHKEFGDGFNTNEKQNYVLHEIKPDKMPVAIYEQMPDFTNNIIKLSNSDRIYLFSDGFADQFGGPKGKKYLSKHFKEEILNSCELSITEQKVYLEDSIKSWINYKNPLTNKSYEQTDDICVMGIEFKTK